MLATLAFDVCHDVYRAAREAIDTKIPTLNAESSGKYQWHPDRMPRLAEYVCDFARAGERALGGIGGNGFSLSRAVRERRNHPRTEICVSLRNDSGEGCRSSKRPPTEVCATEPQTIPSERPFRASRMAMFRVYYLGGADYHAARRHLGISEITWADWAEEIRRLVGRELTRAGVFPPSRYFLETTKKAS